MPLRPGNSDALLVVDVQVDFLPGGRLAVARGDEIVGPINELARRFAVVVLTQDWHPQNHVSFASNHPGKAPFETIELGYGTQVLWPDHCVIGSPGAQLAPGLAVPNAQMIVRKGFRPEVDSYSGFREADRKTPTGLAGYLRERGVKRTFAVGLATDFCVSWTAEDAAAAGFESVIIEDATRPIDTGGSLEAAWARMTAVGVKRMRLGAFD
ncbi:MAG TPA: nicotinamidase [Devosia sp.]|nr:nicotinamidase [Devosia sp.]